MFWVSLHGHKIITEHYISLHWALFNFILHGLSRSFIEQSFERVSLMHVVSDNYSSVYAASLFRRFHCVIWFSWHLKLNSWLLIQRPIFVEIPEKYNYINVYYRNVRLHRFVLINKRNQFHYYHHFYVCFWLLFSAMLVVLQ